MKLRLTVALLLLTCFSFAQNQEWGSYFSYTNIVDIAQSNNRIYAASSNAMFSQNVTSGELKTITSVDGLKAEDVTAIFYSTTTQRILVGSSNGQLLVVNPDGSINNKIDIIQEATIPGNIKKINYIFENDGLAYLCCDFGIAVFNLRTLQFGDTYHLGPNGAEVAVSQAAILNGYIYAATSNGMRRGALNNPNLNDYSQWTTFLDGPWINVVNYNGTLFCRQGNNLNTIYRVVGNATVYFGTTESNMVDLRESNGYLVATTPVRVNVYNSDLALYTQINTVGEPATFTCSGIVGQKIYIGTSDKGVFSVNMTNYAFLNITPNGPLRSSIFSLEKTPRAMWAVYGSYSFDYVPILERYGASKFTATGGWQNLSYDFLTRTGTTTQDVLGISDITVNPKDEKLVYLNSFGSGMLKLNDMVPEVLYRIGNSALENQTADPNSRSIRINGGTFDSEGNLWMTNSRTAKPLKKLNTSNQWSSYDFTDVIGQANLSKEEYGKMVIDRSNTKWIPGFTSGLIAYNENMGPKFMRITSDTGLPSDYVTCVALDNSSRLWIGTARGLRVIYSTSRFETEDKLEASQIIILEDGVAQELMYEQTIKDIEVDGANNKWIATADAGAFLVSPDGQATLYHFTKDNSPLPSNTVNDIAIDNATGEVFFATNKGMVSFKGTSTQGAGDLSGVYVYPNPVRPNFNGDVKITNLTDSANVKITDIEGNLVYEATSEGGTVLWNTTAFGKYKVRSGVYMIFISTEDATETAVKKVMVVR